MDFVVEWYGITSLDDERWNDNCGLYAYIATNRQKTINYIGKVDGCTVRLRHRARDKHKIYRRLEEEFGHYEHEIIVGDIILPKGNRLSRQLLLDIETLLIHAIQPPGNTSNKKSRLIYRPNMRVICKGEDWPLKRRVFKDTGPSIIKTRTIKMAELNNRY